ncbi:hypothetical protein [Pseudonocardia sp.]|uniref:hypothetical protein n=1 Tax=Pseudonocardia sp. TaxID=60912 RepID=UPI003D0F531F
MSPDHRARAPRHGPLRALLPATLLTVLGVAAALAAFVLLARLTGEPYAYFSKEPAETLDEPRYIGWAAHLTVLVGAAGAACAVFAGLLVRRRDGRPTPESGFLLGMGAVTWVLVCDDLFQLHDWVFPRFVPLVGERTLFTAYALLLAFVLWRSGRAVIARTDLPILLLAGAGLGLSLFMDLFVRPELPNYHLIEDGAKFFGLAMLTLYLTRTGLRFAQEASARAGQVAGAQVPRPRTVADLTEQLPALSRTGPVAPRTGRRAHRRTGGAPPAPRVARTVADLTAGLPRPRPAGSSGDTAWGQAEGAGAHGTGAHRRGESRRAHAAGARSGTQAWELRREGATRVPQPRTGEAGRASRREREVASGDPGAGPASAARPDPQDDAAREPYRAHRYRQGADPQEGVAGPRPEGYGGAGDPVEGVAGARPEGYARAGDPVERVAGPRPEGYGAAGDPVAGYAEVGGPVAGLGAERPVAGYSPAGFGAEPRPVAPAVPRPRGEITPDPAPVPPALPQPRQAVVPAAAEARSPGSPDAPPQP